MFTFQDIIEHISMAHTGRALKGVVRLMKLKHPANVTMMYLNGEDPSYIAAACLAVDQVGA